MLLLERSTWPREKVCGGCLSASAVACLERIGLTKLLDGAVPIEASIVHVAGAAVRLPAQSVLAIRRAEFDTELVAAFQSLGGTFVANASASLRAGEPGRDRRFVRAAVGGEAIDLYGRTILACDGLAGSSLSEEP